MSTGGTPTVIDELRLFLNDNAFVLTSERTGGMGGLEQIYAGEIEAQQTLVRVTADRGHWAVQVKIASMAQWVVPGVWVAYLDRQDVSDLSIEDQVRFAGTRLVDVVRAAAGNPSIEAKLVRLGEDYMRRRLAGGGL